MLDIILHDRFSRIYCAIIEATMQKLLMYSLQSYSFCIIQNKAERFVLTADIF